MMTIMLLHSMHMCNNIYSLSGSQAPEKCFISTAVLHNSVDISQLHAQSAIHTCTTNDNTELLEF